MVFPKCSVVGARSDRPGVSIDKDVYGLGKGRPVLDMVVADQAEYSALREDRSVVVERAIAEPKGHARGDAVVMDSLRSVPSGNGCPIGRFEDKEAVRGALGMADWNRLSAQGSGGRTDDEGAQQNRHVAAGGESVH